MAIDPVGDKMAGDLRRLVAESLLWSRLIGLVQPAQTHGGLP